MRKGMRAAGHRGAPLAVLVALIGAWSGARAIWWENPFGLVLAAPAPEVPPTDNASPPGAAAQMPFVGALRTAVPNGVQPQAQARPGHVRKSRVTARSDPAAAPGALPGTAAPTAPGSGTANMAAPPNPPFLPTPRAGPVGTGGRWSLDTWAFWRQGSDAAPISQGRVPIYGASQAGAVLQYRLAPGTRHDPRLYARAYRALVTRGESELALGASARPLTAVPVRLAGELRYTDGAFDNALRPSAFMVTEIAPLELPYGAQLEAYAQAGWVGGAGSTAFADGQASVTREWHGLAGLTDNAVRLSLGAAAWGGAQRDAQRVDIGPTMRIDLLLGGQPARVTIDWRERIGGDAAPASGLAATLSAGF